MSRLIGSSELDQLLCFAEVVECGSFALAARRQGISTSAISRRVQAFEQASGVKLLHRSTHALSPTKEGLELLAELAPAKESLARLRAAVERASDKAGGEIRISAPTSIVRNGLATSLVAFCATDPEVRVDVRAEDRLSDLAADGVDLAIRTGPLNRTPGLMGRTLFRCPWITCASPAYFERHGTPQEVGDLRQHRLIAFRKAQTGLLEPWSFCTQGSLDRVNPGNGLVIDDASSIVTAAIAGYGVAWVPEYMAVSELSSGALVEILPEARHEEMQVSLLRRTGSAPQKRVEALSRFLRSEALTWIRR